MEAGGRSGQWVEAGGGGGRRGWPKPPSTIVAPFSHLIIKFDAGSKRTLHWSRRGGGREGIDRGERERGLEGRGGMEGESGGGRKKEWEEVEEEGEGARCAAVWAPFRLHILCNQGKAVGGRANQSRGGGG